MVHTDSGIPISLRAPWVRHSPGSSGLPQTAEPGFFTVVCYRLWSNLFARNGNARHHAARCVVHFALFAHRPTPPYTSFLLVLMI